jgi:hypothetical protein
MTTLIGLVVMVANPAAVLSCLIFLDAGQIVRSFVGILGKSQRAPITGLS